LKIAHYTDRFYPTTGGIQIHIQSIINYMKDVDFNIITDAIENYKNIEKFSKNCRICRSNPRSIITPIGNKMFFPQRSIATSIRHKRKIEWLNNSNMDVVHVHGPAIGMDNHKADSILGRSFFSRGINFKKISIPKILTMHGLFSPYSESNFFLQFERELISDFETIICVDKSIYDYVISLKEKGNVHFIPNSIDTAKFSYSQALTNKKIKIVYIGRPDPLRGFDLISELSRSLPKGFQMVLVLAKDSNKPLNIKKSKNVKILWNLTQDQVAEVIKDIDIVLNPLKIPVISRVTLEAMAIGRPVITTEIDRIHPIKDKKTGFVIKDQIDSLNALLDEIKTGKYDLKKMGQVGRNIIKKEFSNEIVMPKIRKIYERVGEK